jgi:hypothetical protein
VSQDNQRLTVAKRVPLTVISLAAINHSSVREKMTIRLRQSCYAHAAA